MTKSSETYFYKTCLSMNVLITQKKRSTEEIANPKLQLQK